MTARCSDNTEFGLRALFIWKGIAGRRVLLGATAAFLLVHGQAALAHEAVHTVPFVTSASNAFQQGFVRIINRSNRSGTVSILAIDDSGVRSGPVTLTLNKNATVHLNSMDLEQGNPSKGLSTGVGSGQGNWRLEFESDLDIEPLAYMRTGSGFLTNMNDVVEEEMPGRYRVPIFNPGSNRTQVSHLRLINPTANDTEVIVTGVDDRGSSAPGGDVRIALPAGQSRMVSSQQLESGDDSLSGRLGNGTGKWTLYVSAGRPIQVMSLLRSPDGNLTNLSLTPYETHGLPTVCDKPLAVEGGDRGNRTLGTADSLGDLTEVAVVRARTGTVNRTNNQQDYYHFTLARTQTIRLELLQLTEDADLYLLGADERNVSHPFSGSTSTNLGIADESIVWTLSDGTYYILVQSKVQEGARDVTISYHLRYSNDSAIPGRRLESAFEIGDLTDLSGILAREGAVNSRSNETCLFRHRHYRFTMAREQTVRIELVDLTENADLYLLAADGRNVSYPFSGSTSTNLGIADESIVWTLSDGTYYMLVTAEGSSATISYKLRYNNDSAIPGRRLESAFELGDLASAIGVHARNGQVNRESNEVDLFRRNYYRFTVAEARRIRFELRNLTENADLYLLAADGRNVSHPFSGSTSTNLGIADELIEWTLERGSYYLEVRSEASGTIGYQLRYSLVEG